MKGNKIVSANPFLDNLHKLSFMQLKLFFHALSKIEWKDGKKIYSGEPLAINFKELGLKLNNRSHMVFKNELEKLRAISFIVEVDKYKRFLVNNPAALAYLDTDIVSNFSFSVIGKIMNLKGHRKTETIFITLSHDAVPFLSELDKDFTVIDLDSIAALETEYAYKLYIHFKRLSSISPRVRLKLSIDAVKNEILKCEGFEHNSNFHKRIIERSIDDINKNSDIKIQCEVKRESRKICGYEFAITRRQKIKNLTLTEKPSHGVKEWAISELQSASAVFAHNRQIDPGFSFTDKQQKMLDYRVSLAE